MEFFLYQIVARVVAAYLFVETSRIVWRILVQRKLTIEYDGLMERLLNVPDWVTSRDTNPFRYWFLLSGQILFLIACVIMMVFGWYVPKA